MRQRGRRDHVSITRRRDAAQSAGLHMPQGINVLALVKDGERYVFLYDDHSTSQVLQTLGRYAADPELSFSWYDAAVLSQRVRQLQQRTSGATPSLFRETA
jgi:hypothetical protein